MVPCITAYIDTHLVRDRTFLFALKSVNQFKFKMSYKDPKLAERP